IALILPYVFLFYIVFSFLEDSGYLPRASVLFDNIMRKLGVQGGSLITIFMGYGCAVPAIIGSRAATTYKARLMISTAVCFAIPCISQTGALISLLASYSFWLLALMILFSFFVLFAVTFITGKLIKGKVDPLLIEVPNLLIPERRAYGRKLMVRMKNFLVDAEVPMLLAIVIAALLKETGALEAVAVYAEPVVSQWLGLPSEAVIALILGIIRREMSVAPLLAMDLTTLQAFVGATVSLLYLPCLSVFGILTKEFNLKISLLIALTTIVVAILTGGIINHTVQLFM
ncbi:MAG: ferrous iron transporter B, partial [Syntrophomonadaceae bacterium]|nr:ferrous iron transporter B [Syntrophomonadaceae bacterium]